MAASSTTTPRAWRTSAIAFGLVNVSVGIAPLTANGRIEGHKYCPDHNTRVKQQWACSEDGEVVTPVSGYEVDGGIVTLESDEQKSLKTAIGSSMEVEGFCPADEIDPDFYTDSYNVWPRETGDIKSYIAFAHSLRDKGQAAFGKVCLTDSTKIFVLRWSDHVDGLICHLCNYDANFRWNDVTLVRDACASAAQPTDAELQLAGQIIDLMDRSGEFAAFAKGVTDEYKTALEEAIQIKAQGGVIPAAVAQTKTDAPGDLMAKLQASVAQMQTAKGKRASAQGTKIKTARAINKTKTKAA